MKKGIKLTIRAEREFRDKFGIFCKKNNYVFSKRVRELMQKDMDGEIK